MFLLQIDITQIVIHKADEPDTGVDFPVCGQGRRPESVLASRGSVHGVQTTRHADGAVPDEKNTVESTFVAASAGVINTFEAIAWMRSSMLI